MRLFFRWYWYDLWVGFYYNRFERTLYFCPLPTFCFVFVFARRP